MARTKQSKLEQKFAQRDIAFNNATSEILVSIPHVLEGIVDFLGVHTEAENGNLVWEDIGRFDGEDDENGYIMIIGVIAYAPGEKFELSNQEIVEITEDTQDYFRRMVRIGIPFSLADKGTKEDVVAFLKKSEDVSSELTITEDEPGESNVLASSDFDLDELSEEQRQALEMFMSMGGKH